MTRAEKFIEEKLGITGIEVIIINHSNGQFFTGINRLVSMLQEFHKQEMPTTEEILSYFGKENYSTSCDRRWGAKWATDFVREEKKEPTLEEEINALKEPTVENATTKELLLELAKRIK